MGYNKIIYGDKTLIDLTGDSVTPESLAKGATAHDKAGEKITGTSTKDSDTSDATATVSEILIGKVAYARGARLEGTMPNNGSITQDITTKEQKVTIPLGFHDGSGSVKLSTLEQEKLIPANIKQGITVLGVEGAYAGESTKLQSKTVTPSSTEQTIQPDAEFDALSSVIVKAIPYTESENAAGGITVTIGGVV